MQYMLPSFLAGLFVYCSRTMISVTVRAQLAVHTPSWHPSSKKFSFFLKSRFKSLKNIFSIIKCSASFISIFYVACYKSWPRRIIIFFSMVPYDTACALFYIECQRCRLWSCSQIFTLDSIEMWSFSGFKNDTICTLFLQCTHSAIGNRFKEYGYCQTCVWKLAHENVFVIVALI